MADHTPLDLDALEAAAKAAGGKPWLWRGKSDSLHEPSETHPFGEYVVEFKDPDEMTLTPERRAKWYAAVAFVELTNPATALALIARLRAAEAAACKYASEAHDAEMDAQIKREQLAAAREAHAKALAHALRPLDDDECEMWSPEGKRVVNQVLAARAAEGAKP